jgi:leucyl aminopeptidase
MEIKAVAGEIAKIETGAIIVNCFEDDKQLEGDAAAVDAALNGAISQLVKQGDIKGKLNEITLLHSPGRLPTGRVAITGLGKKAELTLDKVRGAVGETCRHLRQKGVDRIASGLQGAGVNGINTEDAAQAITEGAILGLYAFRKHITKKDNSYTEIKEYAIVGREETAISRAISRGKIIAEAANWARDLVNEPSNFMTPADMAEAARKIAGEYGLKIEVLEKPQMESLGMGALLGVAQGSQQPPRFIILKYQGKESDAVDVALVGKGITFDSGGIDIKPYEGMHEMKGDMAGGASVLAALMAIARLKPGINVTALVPATENMPSGTAQKPGDIVTAMNGKTIEILNTDAEGRLILADALSYAKKIEAKTIIDVATLTGACRMALGTICTGAFTNNQGLVDKLMAAGKEVGELAWQLPMFDEYNEQIKSDIADVKNIGGRYAGAITAAKFLAEFINGTPWVHLDIAGTSETDKDKGYQVKGATGVPVRTLVNLIEKMAKE